MSHFHAKSKADKLFENSSLFSKLIFVISAFITCNVFTDVLLKRLC